MKSLQIRYLGQNGFVIEWPDKRICFDLYLSNCVYELTGSGIRNYKAPCEIEELKGIDYYFISHDHLDHLDPETIAKIAEISPNTKFVCPVPHEYLLQGLGVEDRCIIGVDAYESLELDKMKVYAVPEKHEDYTIINGKHANLGYIVEYQGYRLYHAGDAVAEKKLADDLREFGKMHAMFVPINGHDWKRFEQDIMGNMNYREALDLCDYVGTELVIPMHYDLFNNNTENPAFFVDYLYRTYPTQKFKMFIPGEVLTVTYEAE